ncbi:MAG TPA: flagellar hook-basal body complex protein FliE [Bryobacteraceae bacterium]|jgi:flagellar hook-basal body complex protein FliE|nr:flagellar hook-basal body complex protein FliE [Bryobacteraceae bacterium]
MTLPIANIPPIKIPDSFTPTGATDSSSAFSSILTDTISGLQSAQTNADSAIQNFLTGENDDLHTTVLATQRAEMAFELGLQVRNKVVSAYQEVMKMQL